MQAQIQNLKESELTQVLADGFAMLYHRKPKFPVTYLANFLKNHQLSQSQKKKLTEKVSHNKKLLENLSKQHEQHKNKEQVKDQEKKLIAADQQNFLDKITHTEYHEDILDYFCDWIENKFHLTGVYIGELKNKKKHINLAEDDSEETHIDAEAPKIIYFEHSSASHRGIMHGKTLPLDSVLGKLLTGGDAGGEAEPPAEGQEGGVKQQKPKDQIFFPTVVDNKQLHFFKFPRLGSFFGIGTKINSYLSSKLFDENSQRASTFQKEHDQYEKLREQREAKFRQLYDEKQGSGADEQQLENMEKQYQKQQALVEKPKLKQFDSIKRQFVFGFDTLGQDRQLSKQEQIKIKQYVNYLKKCWENTEIEALKTDIDRHIKLADKIEAPHQQTFLKIIGEQDKEVASHEQVEKFKNNEKLMELEMDTVRVDKLKQYLNDEKYQPFLEEILKAKVLKFQQILKYWLIFTGKKKQQICFPGTNLLDYRKIKPMINKDEFINRIKQCTLRGAKFQQKFQNYAKWQRQQRNMEKIDASAVAAYNIYLAFIIRFLQLAAKIRKGDRVKRINIMKQQRAARTNRKKQNHRKTKQRQAKLAAVKADHEEKGEGQPFNEEAWLQQYLEAEENQLVDVGPEINDEIDYDLENGQELFPEEPDNFDEPVPPPAQ